MVVPQVGRLVATDDPWEPLSAYGLMCRSAYEVICR